MCSSGPISTTGWEEPAWKTGRNGIQRSTAVAFRSLCGPCGQIGRHSFTDRRSRRKVPRQNQVPREPAPVGKAGDRPTQRRRRNVGPHPRTAVDAARRRNGRSGPACDARRLPPREAISRRAAADIVGSGLARACSVPLESEHALDSFICACSCRRTGVHFAGTCATPPCSRIAACCRSHRNTCRAGTCPTW
jgi:hypothetical protein